MEHIHADGTVHSPSHPGEMNRLESVQEVEKMLEYMIHHNASHMKELDDLAEYLYDQGHIEEHDRLHEAARKYEEGNAILEEVKDSLK